MAFNKDDRIEDLDESRDDWHIKVRALSIWKGITKVTGELRGYNIIFFDESSARIHGFISAKIASKFESKLQEGRIYTIKNFIVKKYIGDETSRAVRNDNHIYFQSDTQMEIFVGDDPNIPTHSFDFFNLEQLDKMKKDNRFLTDIVAIVENVQSKVPFKKEGEEKSHVPFTVCNGRTTINVTFFNEMGVSFLEAMKTAKEEPVIIIISSAIVSEWRGVLYLTNFPATRFYINLNHPAVEDLRTRHMQPDFYKMDLDIEIEDDDLQVMTVKEIKQLDESYIEKKVSCKVTVKKFDENMNWYSPFCIQCEQDLHLVDGQYKCCNRVYPYPDKRFRLYSLCCDETGTIPIVWPDDEICRLTGKTIYDVEADDYEVLETKSIPPILKCFEKKTYTVTIVLTEENLKKGSKVYQATAISNPLEVSDDHVPNQKKTTRNEEPQISITVDNVVGTSPATVTSTSKTKPRIARHPTDCENEPSIKIQKLKEIKTEKK